MPDETPQTPQPDPSPPFTREDIRAMIKRAKTIQYSKHILDWMESNVEYPSQVPPQDVVDALKKTQGHTTPPPPNAEP
jgi:hypothetical protein